MTLNLKEASGLEIFKKLVAQADVVVENYRPDVKHRLGIDYDSLNAINPRIILGSISGFGQDGPLRKTSRLRPDRARHGWPDVDHWFTWPRPGARWYPDR